MAMTSVARGTLNKAWLFRNLAARAQTDSDHETFEASLEAAIIFGRSVTFHLQKEFKSTPGFSDWWEAQQNLLGNDPPARYFVQLRNSILKEEPPLVRPTVFASVRSSVKSTSRMTARVETNEGLGLRTWRTIRFAPRWARTYLVNHVRRLNQRISTKTRSGFTRLVLRFRPLAPSPPADFYFADSEWREKSALEYLDGYLTRLEAVVTSAEQKFGIIEEQCYRTPE
jgi:hypothetical protein